MTHRQTHPNPDSLTSAQGEFQPSVPRSNEYQHSGHAPGTKVGKDAVPEFHATTVAPGTAPKENLFQPNPISETPGQADNELAGRLHGKEDTTTSASDTIVGSTSQDVHKGYGKPLIGHIRRDVDGKVAGGGGRAGHGAEVDVLNHKDADTRPEVNRAGAKEGLKPRDPDEPGVFSTKYDAAEERVPESATTVARESRS